MKSYYIDVQNWLDALPSDMKNAIDEAKGAPPESTAQEVLNTHVGLEGFPYTSFKCFDYSPLLVRTMSNLAAWEILSSQDEINKLLAVPDSFSIADLTASTDDNSN